MSFSAVSNKLRGSKIGLVTWRFPGKRVPNPGESSLEGQHGDTNLSYSPNITHIFHLKPAPARKLHQRI